MREEIESGHIKRPNAFRYYMEKKLAFVGRFGRSTIYSAKDPLRVGYDDDKI